MYTYHMKKRNLSISRFGFDRGIFLHDHIPRFYIWEEGIVGSMCINVCIPLYINIQIMDKPRHAKINLQFYLDIKLQ